MKGATLPRREARTSVDIAERILDHVPAKVRSHARTRIDDALGGRRVEPAEHRLASSEAIA